MSDPKHETTPRRRSRFAWVWPDGSMAVMSADMDFFAARRELLANEGGGDIELIEVELTVIRTHGHPTLPAVHEHSATCPTCGDLVSIEVPAHAE